MDEKKILKEIRDIKKLLVLYLVGKGTSPRDIRNALKISGTIFKKEFQTRRIKKK